jgi:hypothetical protein
VFCEKSFFKWRSTTSWKSWFVSSFFLEFFVRVNLISVVCRSARRELEYRFSTQSCSSRFWSWSSYRTSSSFWWNESTRTWLRRTRTHVESLIVRKICAFFRDFDNFLRCFFHRLKCWHHRRIRRISCSFQICCTFLSNRHYKTDIKSKKRKFLRNFDLHRERFDHSSIHCESRETIKQKIVNSVDDLTRNFFFMSCINLTCNIVLKTFVMFKFNKMIIRFVFCFHTMWICSMKSFKIVLINWFFRRFMNVLNNNRCVFVIHEIFFLMMNFRIFSMMFNNAIDRYVFEIV